MGAEKGRRGGAQNTFNSSFIIARRSSTTFGTTVKSFREDMNINIVCFVFDTIFNTNMCNTLLRREVQNWTHRLVCLRPTLITCVGGDLHHWLHFRGTCHNTLDADELADTLCLHVTYGGVLLDALRLEVNLAEQNKRVYKSTISFF